MSSSSTLSDSTTTSINVKPSDNKRKPDEVKGDDAPVKKRKVENAPSLLSSLVQDYKNTPYLTDAVKDENLVMFGLFTYDISEEEENTIYHNCTLVTNVYDHRTPRDFDIIFEKGSTVKMITFDADVNKLRIFKDGNIYGFNVAYTLFGMSVEKYSESTDSSEE